MMLAVMRHRAHTGKNAVTEYAELLLASARMALKFTYTYKGAYINRYDTHVVRGDKWTSSGSTCSGAPAVRSGAVPTCRPA